MYNDVNYCLLWIYFFSKLNNLVKITSDHGLREGIINIYSHRYGSIHIHKQINLFVYIYKQINVRLSNSYRLRLKIKRFAFFCIHLLLKASSILFFANGEFFLPESKHPKTFK